MSSPTAKTSRITHRQKFEGHTRWVLGAIHLPDGERIITCSVDGSLRVWNLDSGKQIGEDWRDGYSGVLTIALSPDGKKVASGSGNGAVRLWDIDTGEVIAKWAGHSGGVRSVCWSQDGRQVLSGVDDGIARQLDAENGKIILAPIETGHTNVLVAVYSPDMTRFATGGWDGPSKPYNAELELSECSVKIWDAKTGEHVTTLKGHTGRVYHDCLAWTPDGQTLISGSYHHSIRTWSTTTWKQVAVLDAWHTSTVLALAVSPNGRVLASASFDGTARLWNLDTGQPINLPLGHPHAVTYVSFSTDGKLLATGCDDNNAYTWDVSTILREVGLDDLLLDVNGDKSVLAADATRRPVQRRKVPHRVPQGFFDDAPDRSRFSTQHHHPVSSHGSTLRDRFFSLFRRTPSDAHDNPSRSSPLDWARNLLSGIQRRPSGAEIELHGHHSAVVDVPYAKGKRRNASAREKRRPIPLKNAAAGSSRPPNTSVTQQSVGATQAQSSSQQHTAPSTTPAIATTSTAQTSTPLRPDATIRQPGGWSRFWLFICCTSPEYADGHH